LNSKLPHLVDDHGVTNSIPCHGDHIGSRDRAGHLRHHLLLVSGSRSCLFRVHGAADRRSRQQSYRAANQRSFGRLTILVSDCGSD
jgi:hypothetical protein